jgi:group I intron endonuclease
MIYRSLLKNSYSKFSLEILEYCHAEKCIEREQYYLNLLTPEYNILKQAGSSLGFKHSEETIAKFKARQPSPETLTKMKAYTLTADQKAKHLDGIKKLNFNKDHKNKLLEQLKRIKASPEFQAKRLKRLQIYNSSPEQKEHLKNLHANPEFIAKRLEHLKRLHSSANHKEHIKRLAISNLGRAKPEGSGRPSVSIKVLDTLTNQTTVYPSISEAAGAIGVTHSSISNAFKRKGDSAI